MRHVVGLLAVLGVASGACSNDESPRSERAAGASNQAGTPATGGASSGGSGQAGSTGGSPSGGAASGGAGAGGGKAGTANGGSGAAAGTSATWVPDFETLTLSSEFYAEGADVADIDGDGVLDLVAGPNWYAGPDFELGGEIEDAPVVDITDYSRYFLEFVDDLDDDGDMDVVAIGEGGTDARWYENPGPGNLATPWSVHTMFANGVGNESPAYVNLVGDAQKEFVFMMGGTLGYGVPGASATSAWTFHPISGNEGYSQFTHGLGVGDVDGDGALDVVERDGWWRQVPGQPGQNPAWERHVVDFRLGGRGGAQMYVFDVDGDGDSDVVTSLDAHEYGLSWFEQTSGGSELAFTPHEIWSDAASAMNVSQLHALGAADLNGDGLLDIVTGKRYYAHAPPQDPGGTDPAMIYWFELQRGSGGASFVPHLVHDASGVGCSFAVRDVNSDGKADILVTNKRGTFLHRQR